MRRVDRAGGREGKKSLRKNKKALQDNLKSTNKDFDANCDSSTLIAPLLKPRVHATPMIDSGCNLVGRGFVNDRDRVIQRSIASGVEAVIIVTNDIGKQEEAIELASMYEGILYACVGVHPDNIKRTNDRLFAQRLDKMQEMCLSPVVVGVYCGLDLSREIAVHFPQEKMLASQIELAGEAKLPLVIMDIAATDKIISNIKDLSEVSKVAIYNFAGSEQDFQAYLALKAPQIYFMISGTCTEDSEKGELVRGFLPRIPRDHLLLMTDSPKFTPQNIEDDYVREQKNEPSNLPYVFTKAAQILGTTVKELAEQVRNNTKHFFALRDHDEILATDSAVDTNTDTAENNVTETNDTQPSTSQTTIHSIYSEGGPEASGVHTTTTTHTDGTIAPPIGTELSHPDDTTSSSEVPTKGSAARYACMMCRQILISAHHVIPHDQGLDSIKFLKRARNDVEFDVSNVLFVKELPWLKAVSDEERAASGEIITTGNIACPECGVKIGKWHIEPVWDEETDDTPVYVLVKRRLDVVVPSLGAQELADLAQEYEIGSRRNLPNQPQQKKKQQKKNIKQNNRSNMGNFRNKSFVPNASKQKSNNADNDS